MSDLVKCPEGNHRAQCRAAFRTGWLSSGADPAKCDAWFDAINSSRLPSGLYEPEKPKRPRATADYDDSPRVLPPADYSDL